MAPTVDDRGPPVSLYQEVFKLSPEPIWLLTTDRTFIDVNASGAALLGAASPEALIGRDILSLVHEGSRPLVLERFRRLNRGEELVPLAQIRFVRPDGHTVDLEVKSALIPHQDVPRILSCARDITQRLKFEAMLAAAERIAHIGSWSLELDTGELAWSDEVFRIFGLAKEEFSADFEAFLRTVHPDDRAALLAAQEKALRGDGPLDAVHRIVRRDGSIRHVRERAVLLKDHSGRAYALSGFVHDITEEHLAYEKLAQNEAVLRTIFDASPVAFAVTDRRGRVHIANPRGHALLGSPESDESIFARIGLDRELADTDALDAYLDSFPGRLCTLSLNRLGEPLHLRLTGAKLEAADADAPSYVVVATDITALRELEERVRRQREELERNDRLLTAGTLAATIAHDVMQPISGTIAYLQGIQRLLKRGDPDPTMIVEPVAQARREAERAAEVLQSTRNLLRERAPSLAPIDLGEIVRDCAIEIAPAFGKDRLTVVTDCPPELPRVAGDRVLLTQLVRNLLQNAAAVLRRVKKRSPRIECMLRHEEGRVMLAVRDNGPGFDETIAETMWQPLVTSGDGIGMGLAICRRIVELHGGTITGESQADGGAIFTVVLPEVGSDARANA